MLAPASYYFLHQELCLQPVKIKHTDTFSLEIFPHLITPRGELTVKLMVGV